MLRPRTSLSLLLLLAPFPLAAQAGADLAPWQDVSRTLQTSALAMPGYVRFNFPRTDLTVTMAGVTLAPQIVQGGWVGFAGTAVAATVMGDLVLLPTELPGVVRGLQARGFEVSAVHNHLMGEIPALVYVHLASTGAALRLAAQLDTILRTTSTPRSAMMPPPTGTIDSAMVFGALGLAGRVRGAVAQAGPILVADTVIWHGQALPPALILSSPINLQLVAPDRLVGSGDFALVDRQLAPVLAALAAHGILTTAVHSHLIGEAPHINYTHFWVDGSPVNTLTGLRAAIDAARGAVR